MLLNELFESTALTIKFSSLFESKKILSEGISHPEDLIISNGSAGAERVVKELIGLEQDADTVSIKWDGFPAVVFGRDAEGKLVFMDKHMYDKVAKGKMDFTTIKAYDEERGANRADLWKKEDILRKALDRIVPTVKNKFWMGDLLWTGVPEIKSGFYSFKPNTVTYQVEANSKLGKEIAKSVGGIAVHTLIPGLGAGDTPLKGLEGLPENAGVVFLTGEIKDTKPQVQVDKKVLAETQSTIKKYGPAADKFIADLNAIKGKSVITAMSPFITSMLESGDIKTNIIPRFLEFLQGKLTDAAAAKLLGDNKNGWLYKEGAAGLEAIWKLWASVTDLKIHVKRQLDTQLKGSEVRALIDGIDSHEGYVFGAGKEKLKIVDRLGFTAAHFGKFKISPEEIAKKSKMPMAAFCFGRMNPPTLGHKLVMQKTVEIGGSNSYIFLSSSHDPKDNPLDPKTKAAFIAKMYPEFASHIVRDGVQNPIYAANWLYDQGFRNMTFVAGSDRLGKSPGSIEKILTAWNSGPVRTTDNARGPGGREHVVLNFVSSGERDPDSESVTGYSGTKAREAAREGNEKLFTQYTGVGPDIKVGGKTLYQAVRASMGIPDMANKKPMVKAGKVPLKVAESTGWADDWEDYGQSEYLNSLLSALDKGDAEGFEYYYQIVLDEITEASLVRAIANHIDPDETKVKTHLMKLLLSIMKDGGEPKVIAGLIEAIRWHVDWPELAVIEKSLKADVNEDKIKGADGKACWKGYRYAGTVKGKDKCVKVKRSK